MAIGKGRPLALIKPYQCIRTGSRHYLCTSSHHMQDAGQDRVMRGKNSFPIPCYHEVALLIVCLYEAASPLPTRAKRLQASTKEMENLYYQHAAIDRSLTSPGDRTFQSGAPQRSQSNPNAPSDGNIPGEPLSRSLHGGNVPQSTYRGGSQSNRNLPASSREGVVDARNLAAVPKRSPNNGRFSMGRTGPIDARVLGANLVSSGQTSSNNLAKRTPRAPSEETMGLKSSQRIPPRQQNSQEISGEEQRGTMSSRREGYQGDTSRRLDYQQRNPRAGTNSARRENGQNGQYPRRDSNQGPGYSPRQAGVSSTRPQQRPRKSRSEEGGAPRRRKGGRQAGGGGEYSNRQKPTTVWTEEELEYLRQKQEREAAKSTDYQLPPMSLDAFSGVRPAVISGEEGMGEVLEESLMRAKTYLEGGYIKWQNKEHKADVMTLVERLKGVRKRTPEELEGGESSSPSAVVEEQTQKLLQKLLGGKYVFTRPLQGKDILGNVARHSDRNESYFPDDQKSLLGKVGSLMPVDRGTAGGKSTKSEAKR